MCSIVKIKLNRQGGNNGYVKFVGYESEKTILDTFNKINVNFRIWAPDK